MDAVRYNEIKRNVKAFKAQQALKEAQNSQDQEPKGKIFESVDAFIAYISRKD